MATKSIIFFHRIFITANSLSEDSPTKRYNNRVVSIHFSTKRSRENKFFPQNDSTGQTG